jgi:hypothetical protein
MLFIVINPTHYYYSYRHVLYTSILILKKTQDGYLFLSFLTLNAQCAQRPMMYLDKDILIYTSDHFLISGGSSAATEILLQEFLV